MMWETQAREYAGWPVAICNEIFSKGFIKPLKLNMNLYRRHVRRGG